MINLSHKFTGAVTLIMTAVLLVTLTLIVIFAGNYGLLMQKIERNQYHHLQAFEASEAGLEFGIQYLYKNRIAILAYNPATGFIYPYSDSNTKDVALPNGTHYTITYSNPKAYDFSLIKISSQGKSSDDSGTSTMEQQLVFVPFLSNLPTYSVISKNDITLKNSASIINTNTNLNIKAANDIKLQNSSSTITSSGISSTSASLKSDVTKNFVPLQNQSENDLFASYFEVMPNNFKNLSANYFSNDRDTNYNSLDGKKSTTIWIEQTGGTATISNSTIGSSSNPVILIVNGNLTLSNSAMIYGIVEVLGANSTLTLRDSAAITGAVIVSGNTNLNQSATITYSSAVLSALQQALGNYAKIPGTWKDFS